jgi:hypothetical protein
LQKAEIHPWDEGLYALRALSILENGNLIDQTSSSPGGLYSSTYPPLSVWAMALSMKIFGPGALAVRLFSYICSITSLIIIYLISIRILSEEKAIFTVILLSISIAWNVYSRQGMTEVPVIFFSLQSLWALIKLHETKEHRKWIFGLIFGLSFALALMTKIIVSFLPLLFAVSFLIFSFRNLKYVLLGLILGLILAFPWHYYMFSVYGNEFLNAFLIPHLYSAVENNAPQLGFFYYLNQLIITNPFTVLSFVSLYFLILGKFNKIKEQDENFIVYILMIWFFLTFIFFSLAVTKLPHYSVYFLVPAVILSVKVFENIETERSNTKNLWFIFTILIISTLWSIGEDLREGFKLLLNNYKISLPVIIFTVITLTMLFAGFFLKKSFFDKIKLIYYIRLSYIILIILVARIVIYTSFSPLEREAGAKKTVEFIDHLRQDKIIYLFHFYNTSDTLNPQLEWYFKIKDSGQKLKPELIKISLASNQLDIRSLRKVDNYPNQFVIYYIPFKTDLTNMILEDIVQTRKIILQTRKYIVFGRKKTDRPAGYWI